MKERLSDVTLGPLTKGELKAGPKAGVVANRHDHRGRTACAYPSAEFAFRMPKESCTVTGSTWTYSFRFLYLTLIFGELSTVNMCVTRPREIQRDRLQMDQSQRSSVQTLMNV